MRNTTYKRISVIMGIYNCAPTIREALDSLLSQSFQDFKVIMCDDCSTDNTYELAFSYANKYPDKFILLRNDCNLTLAPSLNRCLEYADSEYIARMDGDDISLTERLAREVEFLDSHPEYDIVSCPMIYFDEAGEFKRGSGGYEVTKDHFISGPPFCHAPSMVRRITHLSVNGYSNEKKHERVEDYHLWFKMYSKGFKGYVLKEPLYAMRDDRNALSRRKFKYRVNSFRLRWEWYPKIGLSKLKRIHAISPILVGLMPRPLYSFLKKLRNKY